MFLDDPSFQGLGQNLVPFQAAAVVAHFDDNVAALMECGQGQGAPCGFARGHPFLRRFNAVVQRVANQMHQGVVDLFQHRLVDFGLLSNHLQLDVLAELGAQVPYQPWEATEGHGDREHANLEHILLQLPGVALQLGDAVPQVIRQVAIDRLKLFTDLGQHGLGDDQFPHQVDQVVDLVDANPDGAAILLTLCAPGGGFGRRLWGFALGGRCGGCRVGRRRCWVCRVLCHIVGRCRLLGSCLLPTACGLHAQFAFVFHPGKQLLNGLLGDVCGQNQLPAKVAAARIKFCQARNVGAVGAGFEFSQFAQLAEDAYRFVASLEHFGPGSEVNFPYARLLSGVGGGGL